MNLTRLILFFAILPLALSAKVKVTINNQSITLNNGIIKAQFSPIGAKLTSLIAFNNNKNLTGKSQDGKDGALKDFFAPRDFSLHKVEYNVKSNQLPDGSAELIFTSPALSGEWNFVSVTKKIRLEPNSSRLDVSLTISNKLERMAPFIFSYWSHNFFGVPGEDNYFIYAGPKGVSEKTPNSKSNKPFKPVLDFTRNYIAMLGSKTPLGVVVLPQYNQMEQLYSWYCKSVNQYDTIEFRLIKDKVDHGSSVTKTFSVAAVSGLKTIHGAGKTGAGFLKNTPSGIELNLTGFENAKETFTIYVNGKKKNVLTIALTPGKLVKRSLGKIGNHIKVVSKNFDMEIKLDSTGNSLPLDMKPMSKKDKPVLSLADTQWQFTPKSDFITPHFVWQKGGKKSKILFLVPTSGVRDIIELKQRFNFNYTSPTIFPTNWHLSWRTITDMHSPDTGLNKLDSYLKAKYDTIVIGSNAGVNKARHGKGSWSSYPEKLRKQLLKIASNGTGLVIINAGKKDPALNAIAKKLANIKLDLAKTSDFSCAPFFEKATIKAGNYNKGKIVLIDFERDAFIAPHPGYRGNFWANKRPLHRFQEYQFALLGKLIQYSLGHQNSITSIKAISQNVEISTKNSGNGEITLFDAFTQKYYTKKISFKVGKNIIKLPKLPNGISYLHVTKNDGSFGFISLKNQTNNYVKTISINNDGKGIKGSCILAKKLASNETIEIQVIDNLERVLYSYKGKGNTFSFYPITTLSNRHILVARLLESGKIVSEERKDFYLPKLRNTLQNYSNLLWLCGDSYPEYSYFYRYKQYSDYGFNFHYSGSGNNGMFNFIKFTDAECASNGHGGSNIFHFPGLHDSLKKYTQTHNKKDLIRGRCPNNPALSKILNSDHVSQRMDEYGSRHLFLLGDEMSMTFHQATYDVCMCQYCMADFRKLMQKKYKTLANLNNLWDCKFKSWQEVYPLTFQEAIFKEKRAGFVEHRLYMDEVFRRTLNNYRIRLRNKYPNSYVGPTGVNGFPFPYGGNFNFYSMKDFDCGSFYRDTRLPVSFNRDKRLVMRYRGYSETMENTVYSFWEGLALGERSNNNWMGGTFLLPDLRPSPIRNYYSKLLWELRSGVGDLLFHSSKLTNVAAILHSQKSLIINFTKQHKTEFYPKELSFARILEDLGIPHRFLAPQQLDELNKFKVLILPESSVLSDDDVKKITNFVKNGGLLIADIEPATFDGLGNKRNKPALDIIFGIDSSKATLRKIKHSTEKDLKITYAGRSVKATTAKSYGNAKLTFGKAPLYLENSFGKGRTLLLNFDAPYSAQRKNPSARVFLGKIAKFLDLKDIPGKATANRPIMHGTFVDGDNLYFTLLPEIIGKEKFDKKFTSQFILNKAAYLYDVRQGKYLGFGKKFNIQLASGNGSVFAALPYKVSNLELKGTTQLKAGSPLKLIAKINSNKQTKNHVLNLTCIDPLGKEVKTYHQTIKTKSNQHTFTIPFAYNDKLGTWTVIVKDAASATKAAIKVKLTK